MEAARLHECVNMAPIGLELTTVPTGLMREAPCASRSP